MLQKKFRKTLIHGRGKIREAFFSKEIPGIFLQNQFTSKGFNNTRKIVARNLDALVTTEERHLIINRLERISKHTVEKVIAEADEICTHRIRLYGNVFTFGEEIDWHKDYLSGHRWPNKYYGGIRIINPMDNSDIKFPWELNRFQHAVCLGKAYWFSGDEKYADEFIAEVDSWIRSNPLYKGPNWNCAMEVAIRAVNLLWAYAYFNHSSKLDERFHKRLLNLFNTHGNHVYENLENQGDLAGNHYLANLVGLLYIACLLPYRSSARWKEYAVMELRKEIEAQTHEDGTNFEGSIAYHGLATEILFHSAYILGIYGKITDTTRKDATTIRENSRTFLGDAFLNRLMKMFEFIFYYTKPDGKFPQLGDNDSGRFVRLGDVGNDSGSHMNLIEIGGVFFDRDEFRSVSGSQTEEAIWLFPTDCPVRVRRDISKGSRDFRDGGVYILREENDYLAVRCGPLGCGGKGTHNHNDNLAVELCVGGVTYFVDPGTYSYSRDSRLRDRFRSVGSHNTVSIGMIEQNWFSDTDPFLLVPNSEFRLEHWSSDKEQDVFVGEVKYSLSNSESVIHRRKIEFKKKERVWKIDDNIYGKGEQIVLWNFILAVDVYMEFLDREIVCRKENMGGISISIEDMEQYNIVLDRAIYSPGYESLTDTGVIRIMHTGRLPVSFTARISPFNN